MKVNLLGLYFTVVDVYLVCNKDNRNVATYTSDILMPDCNMPVGNTASDIEHDNATVSVSVVFVTKRPKLLLPIHIPNIECYRATVGLEWEMVFVYTKTGNIFRFELSLQEALEECLFSDTTITH
jgi:hypothetical protein